jgi:hypothetical protein
MKGKAFTRSAASILRIHGLQLWARSSRNGGRNYLGTVGDIIPESWAASSVADRIFNQALGASQIVDLACREYQIGRIAQGVDEGVNFCCQSATRSADSLVAVFF